jgi:hypothetical protein
MPKRTDIQSVLVIGSGPIVIGQACEFDYSGTQACRVLKEEGIRVVLVNSNPATIMTDPEFADATYVEPITPDVVEAIIARERPDAVPAPSDAATGTAYGRVRVSHVCLNDDVVEGLECLDTPAFSVQYHPEAAAGPHDAAYLFDRFVALMEPRSPVATATAKEGRA